MSIYGKQDWFCNCCGKKSWSELPRVMGRYWRCCSVICINKMNLREAKSVLGESSEDPSIAFKRLVKNADDMLELARIDSKIPRKLVSEGCRSYEVKATELNSHEWSKDYVCVNCNNNFYNCEFICPKRKI